MQTTQTPATQQQERLVKRAKQANDRAAKLTKTPQPFTHWVHAPSTPEEAQYSTQRSFSRGSDDRNLELESDKKASEWGFLSTHAQVGVFRWADKDCAELSLRVSVQRCDSITTVECSATELREIAARLLDAAYDLETLPSRVLMPRAA